MLYAFRKALVIFIKPPHLPHNGYIFLCTSRSSLFCHQVVKFHHKKDISSYELEMKVCEDLAVQVSRFPNNRGYIYIHTNQMWFPTCLLLENIQQWVFRLWFQESISCRGGSHTSVFYWGRGTRGHEPKGVILQSHPSQYYYHQRVFNLRKCYKPPPHKAKDLSSFMFASSKSCFVSSPSSIA